MRCGYTTGSCVTAGVKACLLAFNGEYPNNVIIKSPQDADIEVPIFSVIKTENGYKAIVIKDAGDDPDITNGIEIITEVRVKENSHNGLKIIAGEGVGIVTKPGLEILPGEPAINKGPRIMIEKAVAEFINTDTIFCEIIVSIPKGKELAKKTLNPILGIQNGLSIIGTSGVVRPMSEEAFKNSLSPQISVAKALGAETIVLVPGKIGQDIAIEKYKFDPKLVIQTSNFIGHMLECTVKNNIKNVIVLGHLGKLAKMASGIFHTHNRIADARLETLAAYLALLGANQDLIRAILNCTTTEAAIPLIENAKLNEVYNILAQRISLRAERYTFGELKVGSIIVTLKGDLLGYDEQAQVLGRSLGCKIK